ncbi:hypothetical protein [Pseudonocardia lacus]|jgi:hypothetical protein|uniref:hypothetical protein n=1 Tax=Pseudonocardia lacus TaxID=2835865 RepID=UPI001BDC56D5|nr:hypothetical protein [Pseudonocardia lacus]
MPTPARSSGRTAPDRRRLRRIAAVWAVAALVVLAFAAVTAVGPVLLVFYGTHGVHVGDLVVLLIAVAVAARLTARRLREG